MPASYTGSTAGITARQNATISEPIGTDVRNAASVQTPLRTLANLAQYLMQKAGLLDVVSTWTAKQTFAVGVGVSAGTADPGSPADGSLWYRTDTDKFRAQANGVTENLATEAFATAAAAGTDGSGVAASAIITGAGYTMNTARVVRIGDLVSFRGTFSRDGATVAPGTVSTICTLPVGYREGTLQAAGYALETSGSSPHVLKPLFIANGAVTTNVGVTSGVSLWVNATFLVING